jgi:hypothetical protein
MRWRWAGCEVAGLHRALFTTPLAESKRLARLVAADANEPSLPALVPLHSYEQLTLAILSVRAEHRPHSIENSLFERLKS